MSSNLTSRRKILFAYDNSKTCQQAFEWAKQHIFRPNADHVTIVSVTDDGESFSEPQTFETFVSGKMSFEERKNYRKTLEEKAHKTLENLSHELAELDVTSNPYLIKEDDAAKNLVAATKELKADMLILGSRGLHALQRVFLGSVSEYCLRNCECPVLVYKSPKQA